MQANQPTNDWAEQKLWTLQILLDRSTFFFFVIVLSFSLVFEDEEEEKDLLLVCEILMGHLASSQPQPCGQYLRKAPSSCLAPSQQTAHLIGSRSPLKEKWPLKNYCLTAARRLTFCIFVFELGIQWSVCFFPLCGRARFGRNSTHCNPHFTRFSPPPLSHWLNGRFSVSDFKINRGLLLHRSFQNKPCE